ncbi:hypothetical protein LCGC14_2598090, partial [marine sediment metagenome]
MKIIVTGGASFIGSHLVEKLVERGDKVTVIDNMSSGSRDNLRNIRDEVDIIVSDLRDTQLSKL